MAAIILKPIIPNLKKKPWIYDIRKSTFVLKNIKLDKSYQEKLRNLIHISERNLGLQNISFFSHYNYNSAFFKKGNPFFFVRKNYNKLFSYLLHRSFLSPNLLKFLRTAYWPSNANKAWRPFYIYHDLELKQRINDIKPKIKKFTYFFSLIFKKNYIQKLFNFKSQMQPSFVNKYFKKLKFFNRLIGNKFKYQEALDIKTSKKKKPIKFIITNILNKPRYCKTPRFILKPRKKKNFKDYFFVSFRQRTFLRNIVRYYFPLISINVHEHHIHGLPMKTKKPKRV